MPVMLVCLCLLFFKKPLFFFASPARARDAESAKEFVFDRARHYFVLRAIRHKRFSPARRARQMLSEMRDGENMQEREEGAMMSPRAVAVVSRLIRARARFCARRARARQRADAFCAPPFSPAAALAQPCALFSFLLLFSSFFFLLMPRYNERHAIIDRLSC